MRNNIYNINLIIFLTKSINFCVTRNSTFIAFFYIKTEFMRKIVSKKEREIVKEKKYYRIHTTNVIAMLKEPLSYESVRSGGVANHACSPSFEATKGGSKYGVRVASPLP